MRTHFKPAEAHIKHNVSPNENKELLKGESLRVPETTSSKEKFEENIPGREKLPEKLYRQPILRSEILRTYTSPPPTGKNK